MKQIIKHSAIGLVGGLMGALSMYWVITQKQNSINLEPDGGDAEVLYWVAPMDPNFRQAEPGKSPMGMDLVPVYKNSATQGEVGTVFITPDVVNNLGVKTAKAQLQNMQTTITTVGYVQYDQDRLVHIHPRVEGWVEKLFIKAAGDPVKKGQALYELYSPQLVNAQEELLLATKHNSDRLVEASKNRLRALNLDEKTITRLASSNKVQQTVTFFAPQTGVVDNLNIREGFFVMPGTTMMSIGALDQVWVEAEIFERQASFVKVGQAVTMSLDYLPGTTWQGHVDYVYPTLDPKTRTARLRLRFDNKDNALKPNMFAQVEIQVKETDKIILIPREAVIRTGNQDRVVLALGDGKYKSIEVSLGRINNQFAEVVEGLNAGEEVVISAQFLLDSESSKTSDFTRMHHDINSVKPPKTEPSKNDMLIKPEVPFAHVSGYIEQINHTTRSAIINRTAIPKWNRGAATMNFNFASGVDIRSLNAGDTIQFKFEIHSGEFIVVSIEPVSHSVEAPL